MRLYELTGKYLELLEFIEDNEGMDFTDTLEMLEGDIQEKAENTAKLYKQMLLEAESIKKEEERLNTKRTSKENAAKRLKEYLEFEIEKSGLKKLKTELFSFNIQNNPASVKIIDEAIVPKEFKKPQPDTIDKKKILELLKTGQTVTGAELQRTSSLRIR